MSHSTDEADHDEGRTGTQWRVELRRSGAEGVTLRSGSGAPQAVPPDCRFDELVVEQWFHLEWMEGDRWWARIGDARISVAIDEHGIPTVDVERGVYGDVRGSALGRALPASYVRFLEALGRSTGSLLTGSDFDVAYVRRVMPHRYAELLAEDDMPPLPAEAFVFFGHHDCQFFWFELDRGEDPPVWYFMQGRREHEAVAPTFSAWLERIVVQEYGAP